MILLKLLVWLVISISPLVAKANLFAHEHPRQTECSPRGPSSIEDECDTGLAQEPGSSSSPVVEAGSPITTTFLQVNPYGYWLVRDQRAFLEKVGVTIKGLSIRAENPRATSLKANQLLREAGLRAGISSDKIIQFADIYVNSKGRLEFVNIEKPAPEGLTPYDPQMHVFRRRDFDRRGVYDKRTNEKGSERVLLETYDFLYAISQGLMPVSTFSTLVGLRNSFRTPQYEAIFFHELAHVGGWEALPEGMPAFIQAASKYNSVQYYDDKMDSRLFFSNELLVLFKNGAKEEIEKIGKAFGINVADFSRINQSLRQMSSSKLLELSNKLVLFSKEYRLPFGGAVRSAGSAINSRSHTDRLVDLMVGQAPSLASAWTPMPKFFMRKVVNDYLVSAHALAQTTVEGWFELALKDKPLPSDSFYYRYMCLGDPHYLDSRWTAWCR